MKIKEVIDKLQEAYNFFGDIPVIVFDENCDEKEVYAVCCDKNNVTIFMKERYENY